MAGSALNKHRLRAMRLSLGLSQGDIGESMRVAKGLAGDWERGERQPSLAKFRELVRFLGCSADWLLGLDPPREAAGGEAPLSREGVLADVRCAPGLRALAEDVALVRALRVNADEWAALLRLDAQRLGREGHLAVLCLFRGQGEP